jgi:hypothetical protein
MINLVNLNYIFHMKTNLIKFLKKYHIYILFGLILILFLFTRFYKIAEVPGSVNQDEAVGAYDAYSLIMTGKDQRIGRESHETLDREKEGLQITGKAVAYGAVEKGIAGYQGRSRIKTE